ncbi:MAG: Ig-like domain-containing protein [Isosphaerales bacterium]
MLANDHDAEHDPLTATLVSGVRHGTLTFNANGTFTYVPTAGYSGTDSFTYQDSDGLLSSTVATATITVTESAPVANNDSFTIAHDHTLTTNGYPYASVLGNDSDADGDTITATLLTSTSHGTLTFNTIGTFTYVPNAHFYGTDSFTYKDSDGILFSNVATVTINVTERAPVANNDGYTIGHDRTLSTTTANGVLANDSDADGDTLTVSVVSGVHHGTLTLNANGTFTYTAAAGYSGTDSFTYQDSDGLLTSNVATVTITVTESAPVASNDTYTIGHDHTLTVSASAFGASGVLFNDTDADGDTLTASVVANVQHGTLTLNANGTFTYVPQAGYSGTDSFTYQDSDGLLTSNVATVTIAVTEGAPVANNDAYTIGHDRTLAVNFGGVLANDTDPQGDGLTATIVSTTQHGTLTFNSSGTFTYVPNTHFYGTDTFTYKDSDGTLTSNVATVTIIVTESAPVAAADSYSAMPGQTLTVPAATGVLANDTDADGDTLTPTVVSNVSDGTLTLNGDGSFTYTPKAGFTGTDSFTYQDSDGVLTSGVATVTITVGASALVAANDQYDVAPGKTLKITTVGILANDTDANGNPMTVALVANVQHGALTLNSDGTFTYTPTAGFTGTDSFTYQDTDGTLTSNVATATITVADQAPLAVNDSYTVAVSGTLTATTANGVLANDIDAVGNPITAVLVTNVQQGTLTLNANGTFNYIPSSGYAGTDSFTYKDTDGTLTSNVATVTITVAAATQTPIASAASGSSTGTGSSGSAAGSASLAAAGAGLVPFASSAARTGSAAAGSVPSGPGALYAGFAGLGSLAPTTVAAGGTDAGFHGTGSIVAGGGGSDGLLLYNGTLAYGEYVPYGLYGDPYGIVSGVSGVTNVGLYGIGLYGAGYVGAGLYGTGLYGAGYFGAGWLGGTLYGWGAYGAGWGGYYGGGWGAYGAGWYGYGYAGLGWGGLGYGGYGWLGVYPGWGWYGGTGTYTSSYSSGNGSWTATWSYSGSSSSGSASWTATDTYSSDGQGDASWSYSYNGSDSFDLQIGGDSYQANESSFAQWSSSVSSNRSSSYSESDGYTGSYSGEDKGSTTYGNGTNQFDGLESSNVTDSHQASGGTNSDGSGSGSSSFSSSGSSSFGYTDASSQSRGNNASNSTLGESSSEQFSDGGSYSGSSDGQGNFSSNSSTSYSDSGTDGATYSVSGSATITTPNDNGSETYTGNSSASDQFADQGAYTGSGSNSGYTSTGSYSHGDSGANSASASLQGSNTFQTPTDSGSETFNNGSNFADKFNDTYTSGGSWGTNGQNNGTNSANHTDSGTAGFSLAVKGTDTYNSSSGNPSSGNASTDSGSESYAQARGTSVAFADQDSAGSSDSNNVIGTSASYGHSNSGGDSASFGDQTGSTTTTDNGASSTNSNSAHSVGGTDSETDDEQTSETDTSTIIDATPGAADVSTDTENLTDDTGSSDQYSDLTVVNSVAAPGTTSTTTSVNDSDSGTDTDSSSEQATTTESDQWSSGVSPAGSDSCSSSYTDSNSTADTYASAIVSVVTVVNGQSVSTATTTDSGSDSSSSTDQSTDSESDILSGGETVTTSENQTEQHNSSDQYSDQSQINSEVQDGVTNGVETNIDSDQETNWSSSSTTGPYSGPATSTTGGTETDSGTTTMTESSSDTQSDTDQNVVTDTAGTITSSQSATDVSSNTNSQTLTNQGTDTFSGIPENGNTYSGTGSFNETDTTTESDSLQSTTNTTTDAAGNPSGSELVTQDETDTWNGVSNDTGNISTNGSGSDAVTMTTNNSGTMTTHETAPTTLTAGVEDDQDDATSQVVSSTSVSESDAQSSFSQATTDNHTDTTLSGSASNEVNTETSGDNPVTTTNGSQTSIFAVLQLIVMQVTGGGSGGQNVTSSQGTTGGAATAQQGVGTGAQPAQGSGATTNPPPAGVYTVSGSVSYGPNNLPVRFALVKVYETFPFMARVGIPKTLLGETYTKDNGSFTLSLNLNEVAANATGLSVQVYTTSNPSLSNNQINVSSGDVTHYVAWTLPLPTQAKPTLIVPNMTISNTTDSGMAFWVYDWSLYSAQFPATVPDFQKSGPQNIDFAALGKTSWTLLHTPHILQGSYASPTVMHEFGHAVAQLGGFFACSLPFQGYLNHELGSDMRAQFGWSSDLPTFAFSEGFANFFSMAVQNFANVANPQYGGQYSPEANQIRGETDEIGVMQLLWDLADPANEPGVDDVELSYDGAKGFPALVKLIDDKDVMNVQDLWRALLSTTTDLATIAAYGRVFTAHGMAAGNLGMTVGGASTTVVPVGGPVPKFTWTIPNGQPYLDQNTGALIRAAGPLFNQFRVVIYNANGTGGYTQLLATEYMTNGTGSLGINGNLATWSLSAQVWAVIKATPGKKAIVVQSIDSHTVPDGIRIRGAGRTKEVNTGPYWSVFFFTVTP